jgi:hypothetical protein
MGSTRHDPCAQRARWPIRIVLRSLAHVATPRWRTSCAVALLLSFVVTAGTATAYDIALTWRPSSVSRTAGYRLYVHEDGAEWEPIDLGMPPQSAERRLIAVVGDLGVERTYLFALSAYAADGAESPLSNERTIDYAYAAQFVDSDHDGLTDAQEDTNLNQTRDAGETDRLRADTDADLVPDGTERSYGSDPLERGTPECDRVPLDDWAIFGNGSGTRDAKLREPMPAMVSRVRKPSAIVAVYPRARGHLTTPIVVIPRATDRLRIDIRIRSTEGRLYRVSLAAFGGHSRIHRRRLLHNLGADLDGRIWVPLGIDVPTELARIDPDAVFDFIERITVRGADVARIRFCR